MRPPRVFVGSSVVDGVVIMISLSVASVSFTSRIGDARIIGHATVILVRHLEHRSCEDDRIDYYVVEDIGVRVRELDEAVRADGDHARAHPLVLFVEHAKTDGAKV